MLRGADAFSVGSGAGLWNWIQVYKWHFNFFHVKISFELLIISEERKLQIEFCLGQVKSTFSERIVALNPPFFGFKTFLNIGQTYCYIAVYFTWSRREAGRHASRRSLLLLHCFLLYKIGRSTYGVKYRRNETNWPSTYLQVFEYKNLGEVVGCRVKCSV